MRDKIDKIGGRKVLIFLMCVAIAIATSYIMEINYYAEFLKFVVLACCCFFLGNGIEHVSDAIGSRRRLPERMKEK